MNSSMVWAFYWKRPPNHQYEDIWISTIDPSGQVMILGNTGYIVYKFANLLPIDTVRRGMRPALFYFDCCDINHNTKENRGSI